VIYLTDKGWDVVRLLREGDRDADERLTPFWAHFSTAQRYVLSYLEGEGGAASVSAIEHDIPSRYLGERSLGVEVGVLERTGLVERG